ncbi:MAG: hypothetical protein KA712_17320 [Myxococcales bacterium]|nr:hypothetical protein [Myxococcales bacterium]
MAQIIDAPDRARRLARAIASDITLYNEAKIAQGIQNDTLFDLIAAEIEEGRALFKSRVTPEMHAMGFYDRAIVDVLLRSKGHIKSSIW